MAIFVPPPEVRARWEEQRARAWQPGRSNAAWVVLVIALVGAVVMAFTPVPFVIDRPGPVYNVLGTATKDGAVVPLISISGAATYPTAGALDVVTVSVQGNPDFRPSWAEVALAWFDSRAVVLPLDAVYPRGVGNQEREKRNDDLMTASQHDAVAAALTSLGYAVTSRVVVSGVPAFSPASGVLDAGDVILAVDGDSVTSVKELRERIGLRGAGNPAEITIRRGGSEHVVTVSPIDSDGSAILGIGVRPEYDFPFDITIHLDDVGGPSAGLIFALGIYDVLTPGELGVGKTIAGTGTIDPDGSVGPVGGVPQKMFAARDAGAEWFLVPRDNCGAVAGRTPDGLNLAAVDSFDQALAALDMIARGDNAASVPGCVPH